MSVKKFHVFPVELKTIAKKKSIYDRQNEFLQNVKKNQKPAREKKKKWPWKSSEFGKKMGVKNHLCPEENKNRPKFAFTGTFHFHEKKNTALPPL